jgi:hypothetical protein
LSQRLRHMGEMKDHNLRRDVFPTVPPMSMVRRKYPKSVSAKLLGTVRLEQPNISAHDSLKFPCQPLIDGNRVSSIVTQPVSDIMKHALKTERMSENVKRRSGRVIVNFFFIGTISK